jgi:uncharacterized membrane protein
MIAFRNKFIIQRPVGEVFAYLENFENIPKWNYFVRSVRKLSAGPIGLQTVFHQVRRDDEQTYEIVVYQKNEALAVRTRPGSRPWFERAFSFRAADGGTEIADDWKLETGKGPLLEKLFSSTVKRAVSANTSRLRQLLETGATTLQDGRKIELS